MPLAAIPASYAVGRNPSYRVEKATHIHIAATDRYRIDSSTHTITRNTTHGIPLAAVGIPSRYVVGGYPASCAKAAAYIHIAITDRNRRDIARTTTHGIP